MKKDIRILQFANHLLCIGDKVRGEIATVELHTLNHFEFGVTGLGFFNGNNAFFAYFFHGVGDHFTDFLLSIGRNGAHLGNFLVAGDFLGTRMNVLDDGVSGNIDSSLKVHGIHAGSNRLNTLAEDSLGKNSSRGSSIPSKITGFGCHLA